MADIRPFRPLRYTEKSGEIKDVTSPPYDIISPEERIELIKRSEYNVVSLELPEADEKAGLNKYENAALLLNDWKSKGILKADDDEGIFVYSETFKVKGEEKTFYGMLCRVKLYEFAEKVVLPHEETLLNAKTDRFNLMSETFCNFSPVYSLYNDAEGTVDYIIAKSMQEEPEVTFTDSEEVTHKLWKISDNDIIEKIRSLMADKQLFIADGHHRYETALNFRNALESKGELDGTSAEYLMMMLVDMDNSGLVVFPTHRLINPPKDIDIEEIASRCSDRFDIIDCDNIYAAGEKLEENADKATFALYDGGDKYKLLILKDKNTMAQRLPDKSEGYRKLDASILHTLILDDVLGIDAENMAQGKSLTYTRDFNFAIESVKNGDAKFAVFMNSTKIHEIKDVSLVGEKMPQKSTYFYPKLVTGLVINDLSI